MRDKSEILVSVIMANLNGAAHIAAAVRSVLRQSERRLELIVSDDGSNDDSLARARETAQGDARLVLLQSEKSRTGPAAARNRALRVARGRWIAVVDNDDFIHPERLQRLINAAEAEGADVVADDLLVFYEDGARAAHAHLRGAMAREPHWVDAATYERSNRLLAGGQTLGYLKPVFRRVGRDGVPVLYDESLRIGEDADLVLRMLTNGARMRVYPDLGYFYRKHAASISHRLDAAAIDAMDEAANRIDASGNPDLEAALSGGRAARANARAFTDFVDAMKARKVGAAVGSLLQQPSAIPLLRYPIGARLFQRRPKGVAPGTPRVTLLSRQRIVGATNGSSAYVLAIAGALKNAGYAVDYIGASPKIFGRWAVLRLKPEIGVFDRYLVHGGVRVGSFVLSRDPAVWISSALAVLERGLQKLGLPVSGLSAPAEYAQGADATRADMLYVARHAAPAARAVLCDYAFLAPLAPFAMASGARSYIIMHDLMSARVADEAEKNTVALSAKEEFHLLGLADGVLAIQHDEAARVAAALPASRVIVAPHAAATVGVAQPGEDDALLFVGSNTAPNVVGLEWFFREIWPAMRARRPNAQLKVAGSVARALGATPEGVTMLGVVADLAPVYAQAGVVISPLYTGSGLKIKLIEALAAGKAVVGTTVTAQGVEPLVSVAMVIADEAAAFAAETIALLSDRAKREALASAALACARANFSAEACFRELIDALKERGSSDPHVTLPTLEERV